jgi:hypothetical protein
MPEAAAVEVADKGVGVERDGSTCWVDTRDAGLLPVPTPALLPWGEEVAVRCSGEASPPATTKKKQKTGPRHD